jgi:Domain of unknown function (DUF4129)
VSATRLAQAVDPDGARQVANDILSDRRFHRDAAPRPLRGPLHWLGDRLSGIVHWIGDRLAFVPGIVWIALALVVVGAVIARVVVVSRRRAVTGSGTATGAGFASDASEDADTLEREADVAERDGDLDRALRLRFRSGLLRLGDRGAIAYRPSVTTGEVRRALGSENFDELARAFERVAYGGHAADAPDLEAARTTWPRVLDQAGRR